MRLSLTVIPAKLTAHEIIIIVAARFGSSVVSHPLIYRTSLELQACLEILLALA